MKRNEMNHNKSDYTQEMQPHPTLAEHAQQIHLQEINLNVFYFEAGQKHNQHLLLIHGLGDEADTWRHVLPTFSEAFHVLAVDLPGFGRSDKPNIKYTPHFLINVLITFLNQLDISDVIIMGSSLGAMLAQAMTFTIPDRVNGLILVDGGLLQLEKTKNVPLVLMRTPLLGEWMYTKLRKDPDAAFKTLNSVYYQLQQLPDSDRDFLHKRVNQRVWSDGQRRAYLSTLRNLSKWLKKIQTRLPGQLQQITCPTLVIRGEFDYLFSELSADAILKHQSNSEKLIIPHAGHLPQQESPKVFLKMTMAWLDRNF